MISEHLKELKNVYSKYKFDFINSVLSKRVNGRQQSVLKILKIIEIFEVEIFEEEINFMYSIK